ncbi:single-stranded DNA-binding protein [Lacisediminihabitans profunda]|uniref:single-stranded DNA-binding protein n=1 Tax=Lacisediminihabitans profunda TaxID=2594790 RepID=UPI001C9CF94B|nr:single-stranded DNA-binding protein [Lacisediminihabitans profunda]
MTDTITLTGLVATTPRHLVTTEGLSITSFRLASTQRRFDRSRDRWVDGDTNWYTITCFRQLAVNVSGSVLKGDRVVVTGRLRIRDWTSGEKAGTNIEVDADAVGHDLAWGTTTFSRSISSTIVEKADVFPLEPSGGADSNGAAASSAGAEQDDSDDGDGPVRFVDPDSESLESAAVPF